MKKNTYMHDALKAGINGRRPVAGKTTRRQQKHDLLLTFMARAGKPAAAPRRRSFLSMLMSVFL